MREWLNLLLCAFGRHAWRPSYRHVSKGRDRVESRMVCYRRHPNLSMCGEWKLIVTDIRDWRRGSMS